ncbi:MAG: rpmB [Rickettsiaceae bacterium]|jgi:large subunit ribosomal protein L28|nr:rpmB [Rickettsiaceae bacterium]
MSRRCDLIAKIGVMSGNNVSHSNRKTRRRFLPNLCQMSFASEALGVDVNLKVAASTLRTINKYGNIDNFLVNYRFNQLSDQAKQLRNKIKKALIKKGQFEAVKVKSRKVSKVASAAN